LGQQLPQPLDVTLAGTFRGPFGRLVLSAALSALAFRRRTS
jgi:hypothetical protein